MYARKIGILGEYQGVMDMPTIVTFLCAIVVSGIPIFWVANLIVQAIEKLSYPKTSDHIRQSFFLYIIIIYVIITWIVHGFTGGEEDGYLMLWSGISFIAIMMNYIFLFHILKAKDISRQAGTQHLTDIDSNNS